MTQPDATLLLFDFSDPAIVRDWSPIDDRIMGGISRSRLLHPGGHPNCSTCGHPKLLHLN